MEAFYDALQVGVGTGEGLVVAGVGDDDVAVGGLGGGGEDCLSERVETDVELGGDGDGGSCS